jgi:hypothetical protein
MAEPVLSPWIPVIVQVGLGLLTIAGSGIMSGVVTHKLNVTKEREEFLRGSLKISLRQLEDFRTFSANV